MGFLGTLERMWLIISFKDTFNHLNSECTGRNGILSGIRSVSSKVTLFRMKFSLPHLDKHLCVGWG